MRKTKIICTLGPAVDSEDMIRALIRGGMNAARFNFSHGNHADHLERLNRLKAIRDAMGRPVATILDTKGPEIRIKSFETKTVTLEPGDTFTLTTEDVVGNQGWVSVTYPQLHEELQPGQEILIDDGLVAIRVDRIEDTKIICTVENGGTLSANKSINIPGVHIHLPALTEKDVDDIRFGVENDFDFIAASFVRRAADVEAVRAVLHDCGGDSVRIIAKIENQEGVDNIDEILQAADGIMVARGDLGVEIPAARVPILQKQMIRKGLQEGKPVITATQMLDSMMKNPRPTRAEATDVANAIYDGTSAIMLSGETAAGLYPVEALKTMVKIAIRTEQDINYTARFKARQNLDNPDITNAISHATCTTANDLNAAAIITVTQSGRTARMISKYRPDCTIIGGSMYPKVCRQLNLSWGVTPLIMEPKEDADELFEHAVDVVERAGLISMGDITVITGGVPLGVSGTTNILKVHVAGHILLTGDGINEKSVSASLCVCKNVADLRRNFKAGDIIVAKETSNEMMEQIREASGLIVEAGGAGSHAVIAGLSLDIPVLIRAEYATDILKTGAYVTLDAKEGIVSCNR